MRIRVVEPRSDRSRARSDVDDAWRRTGLLEQRLEGLDDESRPCGVCYKRGGHAFGQGRIFFAGDGCVVDQSIEA